MLPPPRTALGSTASLPWLLRLRWLTLAGQLGATLVVEQVLGSDVHWPVAMGLLAMAAFSNVALLHFSRHHAEAATREQLNRVTGLALVFDTALLTGLLIASGGATNPFTIFYIVYIVLAALLLDTRWTGWVTLLSALAFGSLFVLPSYGVASHRGTPAHDTAAHDTAAHGHQGHGAVAPAPAEHGGYSDHLTGMWLAFAAAAAIIAYFVRQLSKTLEAQRTQIAELREREQNARHLASLTTLAAGAAHELRTPLSTIAVATHELRRRLRQTDCSSKDERDLTLIDLEVERCQEILAAMGPNFGQQFETPSPSSVEQVLRKALSSFDARQALLASEPAEPAYVRSSEQHTLQALCRLIENALDASETASVHEPVRVSVQLQREMVVFVVEDRGSGMPAEVVRQAREPFFTTKEPGKGMGLGLFLVNTFAISAGGELEIDSTPGEGTRVRLHLPRCRTATSEDPRSVLPRTRSRCV